MSKPRRSIRIIGLPLDLGQSLRGVDMGASALRYSRLRRRLEALGHRVEDTGNVPVPPRDQLDESTDPRFQRTIAALCGELAERASKAVEDGCVPLVLGGDHSIAMGSVAGVARAGRTGVLWIDAHADFNTPETSPSGNVHGMSVAALCGRGPKDLVDIGGPGAKIREEDVVMIGIRDLDGEERTALRDSDVTVHTMREIDERGVARVAHEMIDRLRERRIERLHVSLDLDSLDPSEAPGVGTPVHGGLSYREAQLLCEILSDSGLMTSMDVVEVNPILDERNLTAETAVELVESAFGKSIL